MLTSSIIPFGFAEIMFAGKFPTTGGVWTFKLKTTDEVFKID